MSFSAATCITFNGLPPSPQVGPFTIYYDSGHTEVILSNVNLSELTSPNCPYIISNIDDGTEFFYFKDQNNYCFTISVQDNDICSNCNLGLSKYSATTISRLSCGFLTGSCQNITDYVIHWYGPNDITTLQKRTGFGSVFSGQYDISHPFLGISAIPLPEGVYTPIIQKVIVNGLTFSNTGGTNSILFDGNCLPTTTIQPLTCFNRTNTGTTWPQSAYSHSITFESVSGVEPLPVTSTYVISSSTKFMAVAFKGYGNPDRLQIEFNGLNYSTPIGLLDVSVGSFISANNFNPSSFPMSASTGNGYGDFYTKIICLTGLTVSNNDSLLITVTPSTTITSWDLLITCLDNYNCVECGLNYQPYKIIGSSITGTTIPCNIIRVNYKISGCPNPYITKSLSDYHTYYLLGQQYLTFIQYYSRIGDEASNIFNNSTKDLYFSNVSCTQSNPQINSPNEILCSIDSTQTIYSKTFLTDGTNRGVFSISGSPTVISTYYNTWMYAKTTYSGSTNPLDLSYYRFFGLILPNPNLGINCIDGEVGLTIYIHQFSNIITGVTSGNHYLSITANTITNQMSYNSCDLNCVTFVNNYVNSVNTSSTGSTLNGYGVDKTYSTGKYYTKPIRFVYFLNSSSSVVTGDSGMNSSFYRTSDWISDTIPFSGGTTLIPSLSGTVCNYGVTGTRNNSYSSFANTNYKCDFESRIVNPSNINDFEIWATPIVNGVLIPPKVLAYRFSGGTATTINPTYII